MLKLFRNRHLNSIRGGFRSPGVNYTCRGVVVTCDVALPQYKLHMNRFLNAFSFRLPGCVNNTNRLYSSCWKCHNSVKEVDFFCGKCKVIQKPPSSSDYYQLFDLRDEYELNELELTKRYRKLQMVLHPDKFSLAPSEEQSIAEEYSTLVNKAYSTLRNPWSRGVYLLKKAGIDFNEETTVDDPTLLFKVMERNEAVAEANDLASLQRFDDENKKDMYVVIQTISEAFQGKDLELAKKELIKLRYFTNIDSKIGEKKLTYGVSE